MVAVRRDDDPQERDVPSAALTAWRRFRRDLKRDADARGLEVSALMWNGIRNAWRDGYWTGRDAT